MATRHEERCYEKSISVYLLVCKGQSNDDVGVASGTLFQELRPDAGFEAGDFVKEELRGLS